MSKKTIAKLCAFVICALAASINFAGCSRPAEGGNNAAVSSVYEKPKTAGHFEDPAIRESSGIAASPCQADVFWTHNDSGDGAFVFAVDKRGHSRGTFHVANAKNIDWEDIAVTKDKSGKCHLYIAEIGDNNSKRDEVAIYRVPEPTVSVKDDGQRETEPASVFRFRYPDGPHNAETLLANPATGVLYVLTKRFDGPSGIFRLIPNFDSPDVATAEKIGEIAVPSIPNGLLTGGSVAPDGLRVMLCDYTNGYELVLPDGDQNFEDIFKQKPTVIDLGERKQGEGITYSADGRSVLVSSEKKGAPINEISRLR